MERGNEEKQAQESSCGGARTSGRPGPQRGQACRQPHQWSQGRTDQKPQEDASRPPQRPAATARPREEIIQGLIASLRARFGKFVIGFGEHGIRFDAAGHAHSA